MDLRFTAMEHDMCASSSTNGAAHPSSSSSLRDFLPPWSCRLSSQPPVSMMRPCQALTSAGAWGYALVGQCFSRMHRVQFDEEHQRSLLSCHSTDGEGDGSQYTFPDEAMLELRRRVLKADGESQARKPTFAKDLDLVYPVQTPLYLPQPRNPTSRWEKRKANALATKLQAAQSNSQQQQASGANDSKSAATNSTTNSATTSGTPVQFKTLLSDTEKALDDILGTQSSNQQQQQQQKPQADDVRRLSVDELLALRPASSSSLSTCSTSSSVGSMSPDKPSELDDYEDEDNNLSPDAKLLRQWLADVDPPRATEYHAYARCFEAQGFQALEDLAELDEHEVEQAMSEVGISKFAHRARLRKAILRLRSDSFQSEHSHALMTSG